LAIARHPGHREKQIKRTCDVCVQRFGALQHCNQTSQGNNYDAAGRLVMCLWQAGG
jgi:hypothetical protein